MGSICPQGKIKIIPKSIHLVYTFGKLLGQGFFGVVHEGALKSNSEIKVAIKSIKKEKVCECHEELENLKKLDHPYIVKLFEAFEDEKSYHLVMECCSDGDLFEKINKSKRLSEGQTRVLLKKILLAINYLHFNGIVHRDLKPENFLFQGSEIKLIDFGYSKKFNKQVNADNTEKFLYSLVGTAQYLAPEVLRGKYDQKCDLWSVGVIAYFMITGSLPFIGQNNKECFKKILKGEFTFPEQLCCDVSSRCRKFICQLLKTNPRKRLSAKQALKHKWFVEEIPHNISYPFIFSIKNVYSQSEFKKHAVQILVKYLSTEDIKEITSIFLSINDSNSGIICVSELEKALKKLDPNQETKDVYKLFTKEGKITYSNFVSAALFTRPVSECILQKGFKVISSNKSNLITPSSMNKALKCIKKSVSKLKTRRMIADTDPQEIEKVSYKEFKSIFMSSYRSKSY